MNIALTERLRISPTPVLSAEEAVATRRAFEAARWRAGTDTVPGLVWWLFQEAMETHRRLRDPETRYLTAGERVGWPTVVHTPQEIWEAELQRLIDTKMSREEAPLPRLAISDPTAEERMLTVLGWLKFTKGKTEHQVRRDRNVFLALAKGMPPRVVKRYFHGYCADSTVKMTKQRVLQHIARAVEPYAIA